MKLAISASKKISHCISGRLRNAFNDNTAHGEKKDIDKSGKKQAIIWRIIIYSNPTNKTEHENTCRGRDAYEQRRAGGVREVRSGK
jgi:hypothetical protein